MSLVTLITCWNGFEAEIIKGKLDTYDIPCVLQGEAVSSVQIGYGLGNRAFSVQVLVRAEDLERAQEAIKEVPDSADDAQK